VTVREVGATLWRLAWPIAITGQLAVLAEAINIYWLDRLLGSEALAVEATLRPALQCIGWILLAIATGVSVLVAQSVGAKNGRGLSLIASGMRLTVVAWALHAVLVLPFAGPLGRLLASPQVQAADVRTFGLPAILLMTPALALLQVLLFAASGAGWTRLSLVRMFIDLCVTAALVPIFIELLGLAGAPIGQTFSQLAMIGFVWLALYRQRDRWHLGAPPSGRAWDMRGWGEILDIGLPPQLARIAMFASYTYLVQRVANEGRAAVVGFGIGLTFLFFSITIVSSVGRASGIALAQAIGAKDPARARLVLRTGLVAGVATGAVFAALSYVLSDHLIAILVSEPAAIARGGEALRILSLALLPLGCSVVFLFCFTAIKASKRAGLAGIVADAAGIVFVLVWRGDDQLAGAAWSICFSNAIRAVLFAALGTRVLRFRG
jgi:Na+-driven multidrug efflux pump